MSGATHETGQFLTAGGITIFTQTWAPADPTAVVVLTHGYGEHSGRYGHVADALVEAGYAVAAWDLRGHGRSGGPRARFRSIGELAGDLSLYRDEVAGRFDLPQVLLGHSLGGAVTVRHLIGGHPPTSAVVLSAPYIVNAAKVAAPLRILAPIVARVLPGAPTQPVPADAVSRDPEVVAAYEADPLVFHGAVPADAGGALLSMAATLLPEIAAIDEPLLVIHGTEDLLADVEGSRRLVSGVSSEVVELKTYEGVHHELFNEPEQDEVLADVVAWLGDRF